MSTEPTTTSPEDMILPDKFAIVYLAMILIIFLIHFDSGRTLSPERPLHLLASAIHFVLNPIHLLALELFPLVFGIAHEF